MAVEVSAARKTHIAALIMASIVYRQIHKILDKTGTDEYKKRAQWLRAFFLYRIATKIIVVLIDNKQKQYKTQYHIIVSVLVKFALAVGNLRAAHYVASNNKIVSQYELRSARLIYFVAKGGTDLNRFANAIGFQTPQPILQLFKNTVVFFTHYAESAMSGNIAWCFAYTIGFIVLNMRNKIDLQNNKDNKMPINALLFVAYLFACGGLLHQLEWMFSVLDAF